MRSPAPELDLGPILSGLATGELSSRQRDLLELYGGKSGEELHKIRLSWPAFLQRALVPAPGSAGGYHLSSLIGAAQDALRPTSASIGLGAEVLAAPGPDTTFPTVGSPITAQWIFPDRSSDPALCTFVLEHPAQATAPANTTIS